MTELGFAYGMVVMESAAESSVSEMETGVYPNYKSINCSVGA